MRETTVVDEAWAVRALREGLERQERDRFAPVWHTFCASREMQDEPGGWTEATESFRGRRRQTNEQINKQASEQSNKATKQQTNKQINKSVDQRAVLQGSKHVRRED